MKPRGAVESFLAVAAIGGLAFGLMWKVFMGDPAETSTLIGLMFGVAVAALSVRKLTEVSWRIPLSDHAQFSAAVQSRLAELGFFAKTELPTYRLYESVSEGTLTLGPLSTGGLVNRVRLSFDRDGVTIVGPRFVLDELGV